MKRASAACVLAVSLLAHATALTGSYTFDDHAVVEENPRLAVKDGASLLALVRSNYWGEGGERSGERLFRPVPLLTFAAERAMVGAPSAELSRAVNVLLHGLAALAVLGLFGRVADPRSALFAALIFAVHPLHAEAVAGAVGRAEVLALLFGFSALALAAEGSLLAGLSLLLALGAKESAIAAIPIAFLLPLRTSPRSRLASLGTLFLALALYLAVRAWAIGALVPQPGARTLGEMPISGRLLVALAVYRDAWIATLVPIKGTAAHFPHPRGYWPPEPTDWGSLVAAIAVQAACVLAFLALRRSGVRGRAIALGIAGFELALLPVSNVVPIGVVYAERLLYAPTAWAALALGSWLSLADKKKAERLLLAGTLGALAFLSLESDRVWENDHHLWKHTVERFPDEGRALLALGEVDLREGRVPDAILHLQGAVDRFPDSQPLKAKAFAHLALAVRGKDRARSEALLARAVKAAPMSPDVWIAVARVRLEENHVAEALDAAERAVAVAPERGDAHLAEGAARATAGDLRGAIECFGRAIERSGDPGQALVLRARARWESGDKEGAIADLEAAGHAGEARALRLRLEGKQ